MRGSICPRGDSSKSNVSLPVQTPARLVSSEPHATRRIGFDAPIAELCSGPCESDLHSCGPTWALKSPPLLGSSPFAKWDLLRGCSPSEFEHSSCGVRNKNTFPTAPQPHGLQAGPAEPTGLTSRRSPGGSSPASRRGRWARAAAPPARPPLAGTPLQKAGFSGRPLDCPKS